MCVLGERRLLFPEPSLLEHGKVRSLNTFLDGYGISSPYRSGRRLPEPAGTQRTLAELVVSSLYVHLTLENVRDIREAESMEIERPENFKKQILDCDMYPKKLSKIS